MATETEMTRRAMTHGWGASCLQDTSHLGQVWSYARSSPAKWGVPLIGQNSQVRWHYRDALLVWLFPAAYVVHILEEWFGGFPEWLAIVAGAPLPRPAFLVINIVGLGLMIAAARASTRREEHGWMAVGIATVVLVNALMHILGTVFTGTYSPGLFSSVILYLPLGQLAILRAWSQTSPQTLRHGILAGIAAHGLASATALLVSYAGAASP